MKKILFISLMMCLSCQKEYSIEEKQRNSAILVEAVVNDELSYVASGFIVDSLIVTAYHVLHDDVQSIKVYTPSWEDIDVEIKNYDLANDLLLLRPVDDILFKSEALISYSDLLERSTTPERNNIFYGIGVVDDMAFIPLQSSFIGTEYISASTDGSLFFDTYQVIFEKEGNYAGSSGALHCSEKSFGVSILCSKNGIASLISGKHVLNLLSSVCTIGPQLQDYSSPKDYLFDGVLHEEMQENFLDSINSGL